MLEKGGDRMQLLWWGFLLDRQRVRNTIVTRSRRKTVVVTHTFREVMVALVGNTT